MAARGRIESIDLGVGLTCVAGVGARVGPDAPLCLVKDAPLCLVKARTDADWDAAAARIRAAVRLGEAPPSALGPMIKERIARVP